MIANSNVNYKGPLRESEPKMHRYNRGQISWHQVVHGGGTRTPQKPMGNLIVADSQALEIIFKEAVFNVY